MAELFDIDQTGPPENFDSFSKDLQKSARKAVQQLTDKAEGYALRIIRAHTQSMGYDLEATAKEAGFDDVYEYIENSDIYDIILGELWVDVLDIIDANGILPIR
mgnify:CR=1 FL=1